jgi:hypothetical protein
VERGVRSIVDPARGALRFQIVERSKQEVALSLEVRVIGGLGLAHA